MIGINIVKLWLHGAIFVFTFTWLYLLSTIISLVFTNLLESLLYIFGSMLLLLPLISGWLNISLTKWIWNINMEKTLTKLWLSGIVFVLTYMIMSNLAIIIFGIFEFSLLFIFTVGAFIYGILNKYVIMSFSSINKNKNEEGLAKC